MILRHELAKHWWVFLIRGILAILFAIWAHWMPGVTLASLVLLIGAYFLVDGVFDLYGAFQQRKTNEHWWLLLIEGILGVLLGGLTLVAPGITAVALVIYFGAWMIASGVLRIAAAIHLRKVIEGEFWLILGGILGLITGLMLMFWPGQGALALLWVMAAYAFIFGIFMIVLSFRIKSFGKAAA